MSLIYDDVWVIPDTAAPEVTEATREDLRVYIRTYVRTHGHCVQLDTLTRACRVQFPGVFNATEIQTAIDRCFTRWLEQRAEAEAAAGGGTP